MGDVRTQWGKIKSTNPDEVYMAGFAAGIGSAVQQAGELGIAVQFLSTPGVEDPKFIELAGAYGEGMIYTTPFDPLSEQAAPFVHKYKSQYGNMPDSFITVNIYDAIMLLDGLVGVCGDDVVCVKEQLYATEHYPGISGTFSFDSNGDVEREFTFKTVQDGKFVSLS